jgi:hypothetical protein
MQKIEFCLVFIDVILAFCKFSKNLAADPHPFYSVYIQPMQYNVGQLVYSDLILHYKLVSKHG